MTARETAPARSLDQRRAAHAWKAVSDARGEKNAADFVRAAKKLPSQIVTAGLGQALVFLRSKGRAPNLEEALAGWILTERRLPGGAGQDLLHAIVHEDSAFLRDATEESLLYLQWLNRFAESEIKDQGGAR